MGFSAARTGLFTIVVAALASCSEGKVGARVPSTSEGDRAVACIAFIGLQDQAAGSVADRAALAIAAAAWRAKALAVFTPEEMTQFLMQNLALYDDLPALTLQTEATRCVAEAPRD